MDSDLLQLMSSAPNPSAGAEKLVALIRPLVADTRDAQISATREESAATRTEIATLRADLAAVQAKLGETAAEVYNITEAVGDIPTNITSLVAPVVNARAEDILAAISTLRELREDVGKLASQLTTQLGEVNANINTLKMRVTALERRADPAPQDTSAQFAELARRLTWIHSAIVRISPDEVARAEEYLPAPPGVIARAGKYEPIDNIPDGI